MTYNFDKIINRKGTNSIKWDGNILYNKPEGVLPLWVADMDFEVAKEIVDALKKRLENPVYGYTFIPDSYYQSIITWFKKRYNYTIKQDWIMYTPGVVAAISFAIQAFTNKGDEIIIFTPVYFPFKRQILANNRIPIEISLIEEKNSFKIDFDKFKSSITKKTKMVIFCSPHNPVGRVWDKEELTTLAEICLKNNIKIVSDEIHMDLTFNKKHIPISSISKEIENITITTTAPNKTFNIAGFMMGNTIIPNPALKKQYENILSASGIHLANIPGIIATEVAYNYGEEWLNQVLDYIYNNYLFLKNFIDKNIPKIEVTELEGTFLTWLNFKNTGLTHDQIYEKINNNAKLWLNDGLMFGKEGEFYQRLNIATSRLILKDALIRLKETFGK